MARTTRAAPVTKESFVDPTPLRRDAILEALAQIDRPATFCDSGQCVPVLPGLVVDGFGDIGLPLVASEAKRLIKLCKQAPYGKGTETVVDTKVRKVWELDRTQFKITNPKWNSLISAVLLTVEERLGLGSKALAAQLYKMLIYEKGSFFLPHRDGEKVDGMVATLIINLPSKYTGGELIIRHLGNEQTIVMTGAASGLETEYAAFYADCQHEVKPLLSGYRLCLTYNLFLSRPKRNAHVEAPDFESVAQQLTTLLSHWKPAENVPTPAIGKPLPLKMAVMLDHQYTQDGLTIDRLKGIDLTKAKILFDAAERAQCDAHLALVTLWQSGSAESRQDYGYGRRRYWRRDEETASESSTDYSMGEIYDYSLKANNWTDRQGARVPFGSIPVDEREIVSEGELTDGKPSQEEFEGYTGNAGMTLERWYHRAAIVLWPRQNQFRILCEAGTDAAIAGLQRLLSQATRSKQDRELRLEECRRFAQAIITTWKPLQSRYSWGFEPGAAVEQRRADREVLWEILSQLDCPELISLAWERILLVDRSVTIPKSFLSWLNQHGWTACRPPLLTLVKGTSRSCLGRNVALFRQVATLPKITREGLAICSQLAPTLLSAIERIDAEKPDAWNSPEIDRQQLIIDVAQLLVAIDDTELLRGFLDRQLADEVYDLIEIQLPAAVELMSKFKKVVIGSSAIQGWIKKIGDELQRRTHSEPKPPTDWRRPSDLDCACMDCQRLAEFLASPTASEARFPLAKQRRQHLHGVIERAKCDCTHTTLRAGSPQVLVCQKTSDSYLRACQVHRQNLKHLTTIRKMMEKLQ